MAQTATDSLLATVVRFEDLEKTFPGPTFAGRIAVDIRIERGTVSPGKLVSLVGSGGCESTEVVGLELRANLREPGVVRLHCSRPKTLAFPDGDAVGWTMTEAS